LAAQDLSEIISTNFPNGYVDLPRLQDFLGTLQSFEAYTSKTPGQGYFIFPEILDVHVNSP
jgi:hypothetical protein